MRVGGDTSCWRAPCFLPPISRSPGCGGNGSPANFNARFEHWSCREAANPRQKRKPQAAPDDEPRELLPTEDEFLRLQDMERFVQDAEEAALKAGGLPDDKQQSSDEEGEVGVWVLSCRLQGPFRGLKAPLKAASVSTARC